MSKQRNLELLATAAKMLEPLLQDLVFVGGCTTALLITDEAAGETRPTYDVDAIVELGTYAEYARFSERLRTLRFTEDQSEGAPICRWRCDDVILDLMPNDERVLGFSNIWYTDALKTADSVLLPGAALEIRVVTAPYFFGTKLEAFKGRGEGDFIMSHDLEDLVAVLDGRPTLMDEIRAARSDLRMYIAWELKRLLADADFVDALPGLLLPDIASQRRLPSLIGKLTELAALKP